MATITYGILDDATVCLMWTQRLDAAVGAELQSALDSLHGVERVDLFRYGARIDLAPHVTTVEALAEAVALTISLVLEPVLGPVDFEIDESDLDGPEGFSPS